MLYVFFVTKLIVGLDFSPLQLQNGYKENACPKQNAIEKDHPEEYHEVVLKEVRHYIL